jgi:NAD-dependent histone deacetylase SIR2
LVKEKHPDTVLKGQELFDATLFRNEKTIKCFYTFMGELRALIKKAKPTPTHKFIKSLTTNGQLLRYYTQNIDCLEEREDKRYKEGSKIPAEQLVQLHGTMKEVRCTLCSAKYDFTDEYESTFRQGGAPACPQCEDLDAERTRLGKRQLAIGTLRPSIVLYNEEHPEGESIGQKQVSDLKKKPDLMIVMGTSLKIPALKKFIKQAARVIHSKPGGMVVFVNRTSPSKEWEKIFDYEVLGDSDEWVKITKTKIANEKLMTQTANKLRRIAKDQQQEEDDEEDEKENKAPALNSNSKKSTGKTTTLTIKSSNSKRAPLKRTLSKSQTTLQDFSVTTKRRTTNTSIKSGKGV